MLTDTTKKLTRFSRSALARWLAACIQLALAQPGSTGELRALVSRNPTTYA